MAGYIYLRSNPLYGPYNVYKLGFCTNLKERNDTYKTSELFISDFILVLEILEINASKVEYLIKTKFSHLNKRYGSATEYYDTKILQGIEPYLKYMGIKYTKLEDWSDLCRTKRYKNKINKPTQLKHYEPRSDQEIIINNTYEYLLTNDKAMLVLVCGMGKTLISLWIALKFNPKSILIGVPNLILVNQWKDICKHILKGYKIITPTSRGKFDLEKLSDSRIIIISTYSSIYKFNSNTANYDFKILDEAHHLTSEGFDDNKKQYIEALKIKGKKQLSLTATIKNIDSEISNTNEEYFGKIVETRNTYWGIKNGIICDYIIQTIIFSQHTEENNNQNTHLHNAVIAALQSIGLGYSHHLLIYCNTQSNASLLIDLIKLELSNFHNLLDCENLYYAAYTGDMGQKKQDEILNNFKNSEFGILTCVYCLGEGFDLPLLDGVVFAENMSSNIRIVQSILRASRLRFEEPDKINKVIIPVTYSDNWLYDLDNRDFNKIKEIIYQLGCEDEDVLQKLKVYNSKKSNNSHQNDEQLDYAEYITNELKLNTIKRLDLGLTYKKAVKLLKEYGFKSKEEYTVLCDEDPRFPYQPEIYFGSAFIGWIHYLSIDRIYYDLGTCKTKVNEYLRTNRDINIKIYDVINKLYEEDKQFPPPSIWADYYGLKDLSELVKIVRRIKKLN
jgi:superfamily II DNA or RNA helicase